MIIIIEGIQGSGKTWICNRIIKLKHVKCFDLDDISIQAFQKVKHHPDFTQDKMENEIIEELVKKFSQSHILVFVAVGLTIKLPPKTKFRTFFIDLGNLEQMGKVYRRFLLRELKKITENQKAIEKTIKTEFVEWIEPVINVITKYVVGFKSWDEYKIKYDELYKKAEKHNATIKTQEEIFKEIKELSSNFNK